MPAHPVQEVMGLFLGQLRIYARDYVDGHVSYPEYQNDVTEAIRDMGKALETMVLNGDIDPAGILNNFRGIIPNSLGPYVKDLNPKDSQTILIETLIQTGQVKVTIVSSATEVGQRFRSQRIPADLYDILDLP